MLCGGFMITLIVRSYPEAIPWNSGVYSAFEEQRTGEVQLRQYVKLTEADINDNEMKRY